jgi:hypothetical protein
MKSSSEKSTKSTSTTATPAVADRPFFEKAGGGQFFEPTKSSDAPSVQMKLAVNQPGDKFEQEADRMADRVVDRSAPKQSAPCNTCSGKGNIQLKPIEDKKEQSSPKQSTPCMTCGGMGKVQLKAMDSALQGKAEKELVQKKEEKGNMIQGKAEKEMVQKKEDKGNMMQGKAEKEMVQKKEEKGNMMEGKAEKEMVQKKEEKGNMMQGKVEKEMVQKKEINQNVPPTAKLIEQDLSASKGQGSEMSDTVRQDMEAGFGVDLSNVRIHTGDAAVKMNKNLQAKAFTHGHDIYFNEGRYNPLTREGRILLAHELTHTVQQNGATSLPSQTLQRAEDNAELEKELAAADNAAVQAIDPGPAKKKRKEADQKKEANAQKAQSKHSKKKGSAGKKSGKKAGAGKGKKGKGSSAIASAEAAFKKTLGKAGKDLSDASAFACAKADQKAGVLAENEQTHDDAAQKQEQTDAAVVPPTLEGQSQSNTEQVQGLDAAPPPKPDKEAARQTMTAALGNAMPTNIEEINAFESQGKAQVVGNEILGAVTDEVGQVQDQYNDIEQPPVAKPSETPTELPPQEAAPLTPTLNVGKGAVPNLKDEHSDLTAFAKESDDLVGKEGISEENLNMVDSGDLGEANKERKGIQKKVKEEPLKIQQTAKKETQDVEKGLLAEENKGKTQMRQKRNTGLNTTKDKQQKTKSELEKKREAVTANINGIYERAKKSVTTKLANLEQQNLIAFDTGQQAASVQFEKDVKRDINAWKRERYSGMFGGVKWLKDKFVGIDHFPEVKKALSDGRENYIKRIDAMIVSIDQANQQVIKDCKLELANAQKEIQNYVKTLGPELKQTGQLALKEMQTKLAEMDKFIDEQKNKLREKLCSKREEAIKKIDEKIEKMKEEMSGLISKLGNLILDALVKFFKWALEKAGYAPDKLMEIINKGKAVIKAIVTSPGQFFGNLAKAVKGGVESFKNNIQQHLIKGVVGWLTGAMSDAGLQLPTTWDVKGIFFLLLQILNLTKEAILKKLADKVGQPVVDAAMKVAGFVKRVVDEGPMALWDMLVEQAEMLKEKVMESIRNWISFEMIKQGVIKLVSMLNPVGAIVQLIIGIYNAVMFFVENWSRIVEFVKTIFGSIADIALGRLGGAMAAVEKALGMTIPIILNFIARMLGLSGIGKAIRGAIDKVRAPIDKIVDKGLDAIGKLVMGIVKKVKGGKGGQKDNEKSKSKANPDKIGATINFKTEKENHKLYIKRSGSTYKVFVESTPAEAKIKIAEWKKKLGDDNLFKDKENTKAKIMQEIASAEKALAIVDKEIKPVEEKVEKGVDTSEDQLKNAQKTLSEALRILEIDFEHLESKTNKFGTFEKPYEIMWHKVPTANYPEVTIKDAQNNIINCNPESSKTVSLSFSKENSLLMEDIRRAKRAKGDYEAQLFFLDKRFKNQDIRDKMLNKIKKQLEVALNDQNAIEVELEEMRKAIEQFGKKPGIVKKRKQLQHKNHDIELLNEKRSDIENYEKNRIELNDKIKEAQKKFDDLNDKLSKIESAPDGIIEKFQLGIAQKYRIKIGTIIGPKPSRDEKDPRGLQDKFRKILEAGNFSMAGFDADHATDLSLGGNDVMDNLWPLKENPVPNQMVDIESGKDVNVGGKSPGKLITNAKNAEHFHKAYFKIVKTK